MAAGPATLEVKVKGNHVKFATHHHSLDREINRGGLGGEANRAGEVGGVGRKCAAREGSKLRYGRRSKGNKANV